MFRVDCFTKRWIREISKHLVIVIQLAHMRHIQLHILKNLRQIFVDEWGKMHLVFYIRFSTIVFVQYLQWRSPSKHRMRVINKVEF